MHTPLFFVHFLTTSHGEGSFYPSLRWSKDGIWSIGHCVWPGFSDFLSALKEWGQVHLKPWCLCVQVRFISFFQGLIFLVKHVIEFITMLHLLQIWSTWTRWTWTCSVQLRSLSDQIENHQFTFLKVKMEVENQLIEFQQDNHLANLHFLGFMVILRECTCYPWPFLLKWWIVQWKLTLGQKHKTDD